MSSLRRIAVLAFLLLVVVAAPASASTSGGAVAPSSSTLASDATGASSGGASPADAIAASAQERAERERAKARARKLARKRAKAKRKKKHRRHTTPTPTPSTPPAGHSVFPIAGPHDYGDSGARFGAPRSGHTHGGQDVMAAEGTPLVVPVDGTIRLISYQAAGAGVYVILKDADGTHEYAFMHIQKGSVQVHEGQAVHAGDPLAKVGHTGDAQGPHLHFEEWVGPWQTGGRAVDPLALLKSWDA